MKGNGPARESAASTSDKVYNGERGDHAAPNGQPHPARHRAGRDAEPSRSAASERDGSAVAGRSGSLASVGDVAGGRGDFSGGARAGRGNDGAGRAAADARLSAFVGSVDDRLTSDRRTEDVTLPRNLPRDLAQSFAKLRALVDQAAELAAAGDGLEAQRQLTRAARGASFMVGAITRSMAEFSPRLCCGDCGAKLTRTPAGSLRGCGCVEVVAREVR